MTLIQENPFKTLIMGGSMLMLNACGRTADAPTSPTAAVAIDEPVVISSPQVQTTPPLMPEFDPSIHDYVVNCTVATSVLVTAAMPPNDSFQFTYDLGRYSTTHTSTSSAQYQESVALQAGQRFNFAFGNSAGAYSVRCLPAEFPPLATIVSGTSESAYYLFTPTIFLTTTPPTNLGDAASYVIITDSHGTPIWWKEDLSGSALDAKLFGAGQIGWTTLTSYGQGGQYIVRDFAGHEVLTFTGNLDSHDFQQTPSGTFLAIKDVARACPGDCADMSAWGGPSQAAVIDAEIVELDQDNNVLWTWRTRDHIGLGETGESGWYPNVGDDIIHMNALQPDGDDAVIFSARHLNAIYHITKSTGAIDWKIGGTTRAESLTVVGDTRPTATGVHVLSGQHDVRLWPDGSVSVHDNGTIAHRAPFVVRYQLNASDQTAQVVEEFQDPRYKYSACCGSARRLPDGHWLVAWGAAPFITEFDATKTPVVTTNLNIEGGFSYRAVPIAAGSIDGDALRLGMDVMSFLPSYSPQIHAAQLASHIYGNAGK